MTQNQTRKFIFMKPNHSRIFSKEKHIFDGKDKFNNRHRRMRKNIILASDNEDNTELMLTKLFYFPHRKHTRKSRYTHKV
jgi:hypothetical protein